MVLRAAIVILGLACWCAQETDARDYQVRRKTPECTIHASIDRNPPILGHNILRIEMTDSAGMPIADAAVSVNYYMPPMPGMAPMNYTARAVRSGQGYRLVMDLIMSGPWVIGIRADSKGKVCRISFPIDVR